MFYTFHFKLDSEPNNKQWLLLHASRKYLNGKHNVPWSELPKAGLHSFHQLKLKSLVRPQFSFEPAYLPTCLSTGYCGKKGKKERKISSQPKTSFQNTEGTCVEANKMEENSPYTQEQLKEMWEAARAAEAPLQHLTFISALGGPGSGQAAQCARLAQRLGFGHIDVGAVVREEAGRAGAVDARAAFGALRRRVEEEAAAALGQKTFIISGEHGIWGEGFGRMASRPRPDDQT